MRNDQRAGAGRWRPKNPFRRSKSKNAAPLNVAIIRRIS
jgi:hypothetical protein